MRSSLIAWMARAEPASERQATCLRPATRPRPPIRRPPMARPDVRFPGYFPRHAHHQFTLAPGCPYIEVNQLLKATGACDSGGAGKMLVAEGHVSVGGVVEHHQDRQDPRRPDRRYRRPAHRGARRRRRRRWRRQRRRRRGLTRPATHRGPIRHEIQDAPEFHLRGAAALALVDQRGHRGAAERGRFRRAAAGVRGHGRVRRHPFRRDRHHGGLGQLRAPSETRVQAVAQAAAAMSWTDFPARFKPASSATAARSSACRRRRRFRPEQGRPRRHRRRPALEGGARRRRALAKLQAERERRGAREAICIALGEVPDTALQYARANGVSLMQAPELPSCCAT